MTPQDTCGVCVRACVCVCGCRRERREQASERETERRERASERETEKRASDSAREQRQTEREETDRARAREETRERREREETDRARARRETRKRRETRESRESTRTCEISCVTPPSPGFLPPSLPQQAPGTPDPQGSVLLSAGEYEALKDMRVKSVSTGAETPFVKATLVLKLPSLRQQVRLLICTDKVHHTVSAGTATRLRTFSLLLPPATSSLARNVGNLCLWHS